MLITIRPARRLSAEIVDAARSHAAFAFGRFGHQIRSVTVRLADQNGPRGGVEQLCSISIRLARARQPIVVMDTDADPHVALGRAFNRAARTVARSVRRREAWRIGPRSST